MFLVGKIVGTFGIKGEIKITPLITPVDLILLVDSIFIEDQDSRMQEFKVLKRKKHKNICLFTLEGIDTIEVAENLCGLSVYIPNIELKELQKNEYYYHQLEGLTVYSDAGEIIGEVDHILHGANDILVIKNKNGKEVMVPFADELVPEVNLEEKTITVNVIEGLIEQNAKYKD